MRKISRSLLFCTAVLCMLFLLACSHESQTEQPVSAPSSAPTPTAGLIVEYIAVPTEEPTPTPAPLDLSPYAVEGYDGVYEILSLLQVGERTLLHAGFGKQGELMLLCADPSGTILSLEQFDLRSGARTVLFAEKLSYTISHAESYLPLGMDPPLYYDTNTEELIWFTADGKHRTRLSLSGYFPSVCHADETRLLLFDDAQKALVRLARDGSEQVVFAADYHYRYAELLSITEDGRYATLSACNGYTGEYETLLIDTESGMLLGQIAGFRFLSVSERGAATLERIYEWGEDGSRTYLRFRIADRWDAAESRLVSCEESEYYPTIYPIPGGYLFENWGRTYSLTVVDASGERFLRTELPTERFAERALPLIEARAAEQSEEEIGEEMFLYPTTQRDGSDGRYVLSFIRCDAVPIAVLLWDTEATVPEMHSGITLAEPLFDPARVAATSEHAYTERIAQLQAIYGITVLLGEDAALQLPSHEAEVLSISEEPELYAAALDALEATLSDFPEGFFGILCEEYLGGIVVELCGTIRAVDADALDYPSALTCLLDNYRVIVFDMHYTPDLRYTIFHETAHMIDGKLDQTLDESLWSERGWDALNPAGFSYYNAYNDDNNEPYDQTGSVEYTEFGWAYWKHHQLDSIYFADVYSKTYPTEDRAVLFGTLLRDTEKDYLLQSPHLIAKLDYYFRAIRQAFNPDGTRWLTPPLWEQRLNAIRARQRNAA